MIGNPLLTPSFSNNIKFLYINSDFMARKTTWIDVGYTIISNDISTADKVDSVGRKTFQFINNDYSSLLYGNVNYSYPLAKTVTMSISGAWNLRNTTNIVNNEENHIKSGNYTLGLFLSENVPNKMNIMLTANTSYNSNRLSIQKSVPADYWAIDLKLQGMVFLPLKSEFHSTCSAILRQNTDDFIGNTNAILWDAWISKRLLKNESLVLKAAAVDILNQGKTIFRSLTTNYISEAKYDNVRRYFQLSITWNFSKFPAAQP
ncbi:outer membrane beta-barrel protein [Chitinophaga sp. 30R24]|uniref:outer membrane beta-barrel protein n=1 Tax=Chitinophaga sp. 30R24 TaxID=3248838 RepID=UPI003B9103EA